eukprot:scaffold503_cov375-Pinguiococcus_pyrenoidosus.AAC.4
MSCRLAGARGTWPSAASPSLLFASAAFAGSSQGSYGESEIRTFGVDSGTSSSALSSSAPGGAASIASGFFTTSHSEMYATHVSLFRKSDDAPFVCGRMCRWVVSVPSSTPVCPPAPTHLVSQGLDDLLGRQLKFRFVARDWIVEADDVPPDAIWVLLVRWGLLRSFAMVDAVRVVGAVQLDSHVSDGVDPDAGGRRKRRKSALQLRIRSRRRWQVALLRLGGLGAFLSTVKLQEVSTSAGLGT